MQDFRNKMSRYDKDCSDMLAKQISEVLNDTDWYNGLEYIAVETYKNQNVEPWVLGFRKSKLLIGSERLEQVKQSLITMSQDNERIKALGAFILLSNFEIDINDDILERILFSCRENGNFFLKEDVYSYIISGRNLEKEKKFLQYMAEDIEFKKYYDEFKKYINIPYREFLQEYASTNDIQKLNLFKYFLNNKPREVLSSRISDEFFAVYYSESTTLNEKKNLLALIKNIALESKSIKEFSEFIVLVLDSPALYRDFCLEFGYATQDILRPIYVRASDSDSKVWLRNIASSSKLDLQEIQLAARSKVSHLSDSTKYKLVEMYKEVRNKDISFDVLLIDDLEIKDTFSIEDYTYAVRRVTNEKELPINPEKIANKFGLSLNYIDEISDKGFDGCLLKTEELLFPLIIINNDIQSNERRRFTIAHEVGHYIYHYGKNDIDICLISEWIEENSTYKLEREADEFAASLLMPSKDIVNDCKYGVGSWDRISELKDKYCVSIIALASRMVALIESIPTVLFRFENDICTLRRFSKSFPLNYSCLPNYGEHYPDYTGVHKILNEGITSFEERMPLHYWCDLKLVDESKRKWNLREYSIKYGEGRVLVILEFLEPDEEDQHNDYRKGYKKFGFNMMISQE